MEKKLSTDLSKVSNLPQEYLDKIFDLSKDIIGGAVYESLLNNEQITNIDLGFGTLLIKLELNEIKMKFIPSIDLEADLKNINQGKEPSLKHKLEKAVSAKLIDRYKGFI